MHKSYCDISVNTFYLTPQIFGKKVMTPELIFSHPYFSSRIGLLERSIFAVRRRSRRRNHGSRGLKFKKKFGRQFQKTSPLWNCKTFLGFFLNVLAFLCSVSPSKLVWNPARTSDEESRTQSNRGRAEGNHNKYVTL